MPPEIADFFKEPMEVLSSLITVAVSKASRIVEFQKKHRTRLTKAHSMQMEKMRSFYEEYKKLQGLIAELSKEKEILQRKCAAYENEIKNYQNGGAAIFRHPNTASPMAGPIPQHKFEFLLSQSSQGDASDTQTPRLTMPRFGKMTPTNDKNFSTPASSSTMSSLAFRVNQNLAVSSSGGFLTPVPSDPSPQSGRPTGSSITAFLKALSGKS
ncbi:uncharacterized protein LOC136034535 [Artemia franciscana]|uniref:Uncharacterized protein n=1 Tax=Artemia franciscana TaxID=6661 RepID=A0AA88II75_ARTSF|nr:hypothetical protein QYM36_002724 [Artemia franciscana]